MFVCFHFGSPVVQVPFVEMIILSSLSKTLNVCQKSVGYVCESLFLDPVFYSIHLCVPLPIPCCIDYGTPIRSILTPPTLFFFFQTVLVILVLFPDHIDFRISLSGAIKYPFSI